MNNDGASLLPERPALAVRVAAGQLGVSVSMVYKLVRQRQLAGYTVGSRVFIYADSIGDYRRRQEFGPASETIAAELASAPARPRQRQAKPAKTLDLPSRRHLH